MIDGLYLPAKPAIVIPKPQELVRPGDPQFFVAGGLLLNPYGFGGGFQGLTAAGPASITSRNNWSNQTFRICIAGANVSNSGSQCRLTLRGPDTSGPATITKIYAGIGAGGGSFSFAGTPTQFLFSGGATASIANNTDQQTDVTACAVTAGSDFVVAIYTSGATFWGEAPSLPTGWTVEFKTGDDAATVTASGYTTYTKVEMLKLVEV